MTRWSQGYPVRTIRTNSVDYGHPASSWYGRSRTRGPIVYNRRGKVTDGNYRLKEARARGQRHIEAIYVPDSDIHRGGGCGLLLLATGGTAAVLGSSTWLALSGYLA